MRPIREVGNSGKSGATLRRGVVDDQDVGAGGRARRGRGRSKRGASPGRPSRCRPGPGSAPLPGSSARRRRSWAWVLVALRARRAMLRRATRRSTPPTPHNAARASPDAEDRLPRRVAEHRVDDPRDRDHEPVPEGDLRGVGIDVPEQQAIAERGEQPDRVEVAQPDQLQVGGGQRAEGLLGVASIVADRPVERREEPLVGRREGDDVPARPEPLGGAGDLGRVVLDVLQDVHVEQRVESPPRPAGRPGCRPDLAALGSRRSRSSSSAGRRARRRAPGRPIGAGRPGRAAGSSRPARRRPPARRAEVRSTRSPEVRLPAPRGGEQVEFGADVGVIRHGGSLAGMDRAASARDQGTAGEDLGVPSARPIRQPDRVAVTVLGPLMMTGGNLVSPRAGPARGEPSCLSPRVDDPVKMKASAGRGVGPRGMPSVASRQGPVPTMPSATVVTHERRGDLGAPPPPAARGGGPGRSAGSSRARRRPGAGRPRGVGPGRRDRRGRPAPGDARGPRPGGPEACPSGLFLVLDPRAHPGVTALAFELGATLVMAGIVPPPRVAAMVLRWLPLARRRAEGAPGGRPRPPGPRPGTASTDQPPRTPPIDRETEKGSPRCSARRAPALTEQDVLDALKGVQGPRPRTATSSTSA